MQSTITILLIEDNKDDAILIDLMLAKVSRPVFESVHASRLSEGLHLLAGQRFDIVLLDLGLPDCAGFEGIQRLKEKFPDIPIIVLTGHDDEEAAIKALHLDAQDYLTKGKTDSNLLVRAIRYSIERKRVTDALHRSEARFRRLSESGVLGIAYFDVQGRIHDANETFLSLIGSTSEELARGDVRWDSLLPKKWLPHMTKIGEMFKNTGRIAPYETEYITRKGSRRWALFGAARTGENGEGIAFGVDITERKRLEEEVRHLANHDPLTELPNRRLFLELMKFELAEARRNRTKTGLLFLDLDKFKEVNDKLGHQAGDDLLKSVARKLRGVIRERDVVARLGGDEFSVLIPAINNPDDMILVVKKILHAFQESCILSGQEHHITASIGMSVFPDDSDDIELLFRYADAALYRAKEKGRNRFEFYGTNHRKDQ